MAITLVVTLSGSAVAGRSLRGMVSITNESGPSVAIDSMVLSESTKMGVAIGGPRFLTPNVVGVGATPIIATSSTSHFPFSLMVPSPNTPGASPSATRHHDDVFPSNNSQCQLNLDVRAIDQVSFLPEVARTSFEFPVITSVAPFPVPQGGALQYNAGGCAVNWFF